MIKLYEDLRIDSCCKNMDLFHDNLCMSIKVLSHTIALNEILKIYTPEYIKELKKNLKSLRNIYSELFDIEELDDIINC